MQEEQVSYQLAATTYTFQPFSARKVVEICQFMQRGTQVSPTTKKCTFHICTTCNNTFCLIQVYMHKKNALLIYYLHYDVHALFVGEFMLQLLLFFPPFLVEGS